MLLEILSLAVSHIEPPITETVPIEATSTETQTDEAESGETVIVKSKRISKPFSNVSFEKLDIYLNPASKADAILAVADLQFATNNNNSAEISFRGGSPRLSRAYFNDVPIYEIVRGTNFLNNTQGFSIFNTSTIAEVETYSTAPPAYFANTAGGVIRILPQDQAIKEGEFQINTTKASFVVTNPNKDEDKGFAQFFGDVSNLAPLLAMNPALKDNVNKSNGTNLGVNLLYRLRPETEIRFLSVVDAEKASYFFDPFDTKNILDNKKQRNYNVISLEQEFSKSRAKIDIGKSFVKQTTKLNGNIYSNDNQYNYIDANLAGRIKSLKMSYRFGYTYEEFLLKSEAIIRPLNSGLEINATTKEKAKYDALYGFANYSPTENLSIAFGVREYINNDKKLKPSRQISAAYQDDNREHNYILSYGEYGAIVLPNRTAFEGIFTAKSQQTSFDYKFTRQSTSFGFGLYQKFETIGSNTTKINGFDASYKFQLGDRTEITTSYARSLPYSIVDNVKERGENHLDYMFKIKTKIALNSFRLLNFTYTAMSGQVYSIPTGSIDDGFGGLKPVYLTRNDKQLGDYQSLDFSYVTKLKIWPNENKPITYLNINNIFDRENQSGIEFNQNSGQSGFREYIGRTIVLGLLFQF